MHVTSIETIPVEVPVKSLESGFGIAPYVDSGRLHQTSEALSFEEALEENDQAATSGKKLLIRLETNVGVTGWGETNVPTMEMGETIIEELIAPKVIGRQVWNIEDLVGEFKTYASWYYMDVTAFVGGVEMAMWDALGKHLEMPVHRFIGGKGPDSVPVAFCLGLLSPEESRQHARFARAEGFSVLKTKASRYWEDDLERVKAMHDEVDGELAFRVDPNQAWTFEDTVRFGAQLEDAGIYLQYLEQPIRVDAFGTLKRLRERLQTPIAINEDSYFQHNLSQITKEDAIDAAVVDIIPSGGILQFKKIAAVAEEAGISLAHHSNFDLGIKMAAKLQVATSTPALNLALDSVYYAYEDHLLETPLEYSNGQITVPERPGLAGRINEAKVEEYRLD